MSNTEIIAGIEVSLESGRFFRDISELIPKEIPDKETLLRIILRENIDSPNTLRDRLETATKIQNKRRDIYNLDVDGYRRLLHVFDDYYGFCGHS